MKKAMQKLLFASVMSCLTLLSYSQQRTVTGTVSDNKGTPIANVSYIVKGTTAGGVTDENGNFSVSIDGNDTVLEFTSVGYTKKKLLLVAIPYFRFRLKNRMLLEWKK
ncbi:carboxypeptidase-like regulatory domain-containing protein [Niabella ginsengisoli]|uniref:Carboxypeptidase-like regulatory domain-containing protein n=1 Tax=Niabella ginsengisoli TaxID=522298 RepID=A0ABS9SH26_9BACT|nr:carboxypeptidase-like regulatory domain-containing protein [Niabella ginsengisoli]MCH5597621.1 carboxypeptidase-like regulatory domain-containing protein [Niabella ginsengisoli]